MKIEVSVNGEKRAADVEPRLLLVHLIREIFRLTGTHVGCDTTHCGACTLLLDGRAVKSCTVFAVQADGREVMTVGGPGDVGIRPGAWVVVATHGRFDEDALAHALRSEARYVSLVASPKRAAAVREALQARGVAPDHLARLKAPAGLDLGAVTPEEIAVSILAEIVQHRRSAKPDAGISVRAATEARDPICGMLVDIASAVHRSEVRGEPVYFCCRHCKETFDRDSVRP